MITVLVVDDQTLLREALCDVLAAQSDIKVVGGFANGEAAVHMAGELRPQVILLDGAEPYGVVSGVEAMHRVSPRSQCIVLTSFQDPTLIQQVLHMRASGFLTKNLRRAEVLAAIRSVTSHPGQIFMSVPKESVPALLNTSTVQLSARELQVMENVARGLSNSQIATRLTITEATVKRHLSNVFEKLGAVSRIDAVNKAKSMLILRFSRKTGPYLRPEVRLEM
ncbi:response regulator transcription factor [Streptomyces halstedii]|uniref:response regulator transcription factor n=1 Tax=Streptomyces halstedii TaxID=1944 RepID=UPI000A9056CF